MKIRNYGNNDESCAEKILTLQVSDRNASFSVENCTNSGDQRCRPTAGRGPGVPGTPYGSRFGAEIEVRNLQTCRIWTRLRRLCHRSKCAACPGSGSECGSRRSALQHQPSLRFQCHRNAVTNLFPLGANRHVAICPKHILPKVGLEPKPSCEDRILSPGPTSCQALRNKAKASIQQSLAPQCIHDNSDGDPDLVEILDACPGLPKAIRQGIIAIVRASTKASA
jgi:hypothetical protein